MGISYNIIIFLKLKRWTSKNQCFREASTLLCQWCKSLKETSLLTRSNWKLEWSPSDLLVRSPRQWRWCPLLRWRVISLDSMLVKISVTRQSIWSSKVINSCREKCQERSKSHLPFLFQLPLIKVFAVPLILVSLEKLKSSSMVDTALDPRALFSLLERRDPVD